MNQAIKTNNKKAWDSLYGQGYASGGSILPSWGVHGIGQDLTKDLLIIRGKTILELACGDGQSLPYVLENKPVNYVGTDVSETAIALAQSKFQEMNTSFLQSDFSQELPFEDGSFDEIFSVYGIGWSTDIKKTISEIYRVLKSGGTFTFSWDHYLARVVDDTDGKVFLRNSYNEEIPTIRYNWNQTGHNIQSFQAKPSTWIRLFQDAGFVLEKFYELETEIDDEQKHSFSKSYDPIRAKTIPFTILIQVKK